MCNSYSYHSFQRVKYWQFEPESWNRKGHNNHFARILLGKFTSFCFIRIITIPIILFSNYIMHRVCSLIGMYQLVECRSEQWYLPEISISTLNILFLGFFAPINSLLIVRITSFWGGLNDMSGSNECTGLNKTSGRNTVWNSEAFFKIILNVFWVL